MKILIDNVHISTIKPLDTVFHNGKIRTVCSNDLSRSNFMGLTLFGDSYRLGYALIKKIR